jgi:hypothetical protein
MHFAGEKDICGFDARSRRVTSSRHGAYRQLPDLIESTEPFAGHCASCNADKAIEVLPGFCLAGSII